MLRFSLLGMSFYALGWAARGAETSSPPDEVAGVEWPLSRYWLYSREPRPPESIPPTQTELELRRLAQIDAATEVFSAPPLIVSRISSLSPTAGDGSATQELMRAERHLLRDRAFTADKLFNQGRYEEAIELMAATERILKTIGIRVIALNRLAAYHFRLNQYEQTAAYARRAWELDPQDPASACNVAAALLTVGQVDEALDILLRIYGQVFDRRELAFSVHFNLACAFSLKGELVKSLQNLALAARVDPIATYTVLVDPQLDAVRDTPEFKRIQEALSQMLHRANAAEP